MLKTLQTIKKQDQENRSVKIPETVQDLIPVSAVYEGGIFRHGNNKYSMCYRFTDVNFCVSSNADQTEIFYKYEDIINSYDIGAEIKLTINNKRIDLKEFRDTLLLNEEQGEDLEYLNVYKREYNQMLLDKISESNNIIQEKYLTVSVYKKDLVEARAYFARIYTELNIRFKAAGAELIELSTEERLKIFYNFFRPNEISDFYYKYKNHKKLGHSFKDYICPDQIELIDDHTLKLGERYARVLFLKDYATYNKVQVLPEFTEINKNLMISIDSITIPTDEAVKDVEMTLLGAEANITKWGQRQTANKNFVSEIPPQLKQARDEINEVLSDLTTRDQKMFLCIFTLIHTADTLEELNEDTESIKTIAVRNRCQLSVLRWQQVEGLSTVLPWGVRYLNGFRTLSTEQLASFMPFHVQNVQQKGGEYFGQNAVNHNLIIVNKTLYKNGNSWILGTSGAGKSFAAKQEIVNYMLCTDGDIIIIDPEREYGDLTRALKGSVIELSALSENHINALDINENYSDEGDSVTLKSQFIMSVCEQALKGSRLTARDESIIDRCAREVYKDYVANGYQGECPTLTDFYNILKIQPEEEAQRLALALELFTVGSLNTFAKQTNVDVNNRLICYDMLELTQQSEQLTPIGMLIVLDAISNRLSYNREHKRNTYIFIDEIYLMFMHEYAATFLFKLWKRIRKYKGFCTGITQNIGDLLQSHKAETMLSNSEFIILLSQSESDIHKLQKLLNISDTQTDYISDVPAGTGLIKAGKNLIPFVNKFPKDTELYRLMDTSNKNVEDEDE